MENGRRSRRLSQSVACERMRGGVNFIVGTNHDELSMEWQPIGPGLTVSTIVTHSRVTLPVSHIQASAWIQRPIDRLFNFQQVI